MKKEVIVTTPQRPRPEFNVGDFVTGKASGNLYLVTDKDKQSGRLEVFVVRSNEAALSENVKITIDCSVLQPIYGKIEIIQE